MGEPKPNKRNHPQPPAGDTLRAAYQWAKPRIDAVGEDDLVVINVDVATTASTVLAAAPRIAAISDELLALQGIDGDKVRHIGRYAMACLAADMLAQRAVPQEAQIAPLLAEGQPLRSLMLTNAEGLALAGLLPAAEVARIRSGRGLLDFASDLVALADLYDDHWATLAGRTPITRAQIDRALVLGTALHAVIGGRDLSPDPTAKSDDPARTRHRALSLMMHAYDECRRGVTFVRWHHGDADAFTPSLYRGRGRRPAGNGTDADDTAAEDETVAADPTVDADMDPERTLPPIEPPLVAPA